MKVLMVINWAPLVFQLEVFLFLAVSKANAFYENKYYILSRHEDKYTVYKACK